MPNDKTNLMRLLDGKKVSYIIHTYNPAPTMTGEEIAALLNEPPSSVFKTLVTRAVTRAVTRGSSNSYYVFVVPVNAELDLKKAAKAAGEKSVAMIKQKELLPLTGYVHGGCSPIGMKKQFPTFIHETAKKLKHDHRTDDHAFYGDFLKQNFTQQVLLASRRQSGYSLPIPQLHQ